VFWFNECCCCRRMEFSLAAVHTVPTPAAACCQCHAPSAASCWWPALELAAAFPLDLGHRQVPVPHTSFITCVHATAVQGRWQRVCCPVTYGRGEGLFWRLIRVRRQRGGVVVAEDGVLMYGRLHCWACVGPHHALLLGTQERRTGRRGAAEVVLLLVSSSHPLQPLQLLCTIRYIAVLACHRL
jgi:hypothetical protein